MPFGRGRDRLGQRSSAINLRISSRVASPVRVLSFTSSRKEADSSYLRAKALGSHIPQ